MLDDSSENCIKSEAIFYLNRPNARRLVQLLWKCHNSPHPDQVEQSRLRHFQSSYHPRLIATLVLRLRNHQRRSTRDEKKCFSTFEKRFNSFIAIRVHPR